MDRIYSDNLSQEEYTNLLWLKRKNSINSIIVGLSSLVWVLDILRLKLIAFAFGWQVGMKFLAIISIANLALGLITFTPGGIGIVEGGLVGTLSYFRVPLMYSVPLVLVERLISYVTSTAVGFVTLVASGSVDIWRGTKLR